MLKWCKIAEGWDVRMGGNFKISCCRGQMLLVACDRMKLTDLNRNYVDKMVKPDWSNFPRHIDKI